MNAYRISTGWVWRIVVGAVLLALVCGVASASESAVLKAPADLSVGGRSSATVLALDPSTRKPVVRPVSLVLVAQGGEEIPLISGQTSSQGPGIFSFDVPFAAPGAYRVRATIGGSEVLETDVTLTSTPALLIETDKPVYRPSQTIQGRVVRLDSRLQPSSGPVEVSFFDGKGIRVARQNLEAGEFGVAPFSLKLASEVNEGQWRIRAGSDNVESSRDLRVENYVLPRFEANITFGRPWALPSEAVEGSIRADYFYGKPVQGTVHLTASRWVGFWDPYDSIEGSLSEGSFDFRIKPVEYVIGTPQDGGQSSIRIDAQVVDSVGNSQTIVDSLLISPAPVVLRLLAGSNTLRPGLESPLSVRATTPDGEPVSISAEITATYRASGEGGRVDRETLAIEGGLVWTLRPPPGTLEAEIVVSTEAAGIPISTAIRLTGSYSMGGGFLELTRTDGEGPASLGQTLSYRVAATRAGTIYYEVYGGGGTVFSSYTETGQFSFPVTVEMIPTARVLVYQITPENEIAADSARLETRLPIEATLQAGFDEGEVGPGDTVTVTLDTGLSRRALLGVSIVDESVLALGRSRLHLEEVFEELERRFLEPQVEVEEEGPGGFIGPPGLGIPFFAPFEVPSARSVFDSIGIQVATTPDIALPAGLELDFGLPINLSPPPTAGPGEQVAAAEAPRVRQFFPETWLWNPTLLTDEQGRATLKLTAPDSITGWRLAAVGTQVNPDGPGISFGEAELKVFQDFFVEPSLPEAVVRGERFPLRIDVFNYSNLPQTIRLQVDEESGFELLAAGDRTVSLPPNGSTSVEFPLRAGKAGDFPLRVTALGSSRSDAVLRTMHVVPEGYGNESVFNGVIRAGETADLEISAPANVVEDSLRVFLNLTPSPVGQALQGVSDLLGMPYGCGEQNMIFLAPDIEVLKYLREIGELSPEIRATAENFVNTGYQRQLTFQSGDGGFAAFGGPNGSLWLTAFVLSSFSGAREVRDIDETVLARAAAMLVSRQREDGSFIEDGFLIHTELLGGAGRSFAIVAYVANALADYGGPEVGTALDRAASYLQAARTDPEVYSDPYALAIAAVVLQKVDGYGASAESILDRLLELAISDQAGLHWEPYPVETTGYALLALLASNAGEGRPEVGAVLDWLSTRRNLHGGYGGSTQDTVVALKALFTAARKVNRSLNLTVDVVGRNGQIGSLTLNESNFDLLQQMQLPVQEAPFRLIARGSGRSSYQVATRYNLPVTFSPPGRDLVLEVSYGADHVDVDDIVDVAVTLGYTGAKERTGMLIVDVSVPTGFDTVEASLTALIDAELVERIERAGRKRIFYIDHLGGGAPLEFTFQIRALFPIRAEGVLSQAYEYYDTSIRAFDVKPEIEVLGPDQAPRIESVSVDSAAGGSRITLFGQGFSAGGVEVFFNGVAGGDVEVLDDGALRVTVPNLVPGVVSVEVVTANGRTTWDGGDAAFAVAPFQLFLPVYSTDSGQATGFNGYAFANYSERAAHLQIRAIPSGASVGLEGESQSTLSIDPGAQMALLEEQLLGSSLHGEGWIEINSDNSDLAGTFQFGGPGLLDGCAPFRTGAKRLWFTRVHHGPGAFHGATASTRLTLANPDKGAARLRLTLHDAIRQVVRIRELGPRESFTETIEEIFGARATVSRGYVDVEVLEGSGVVGFERVDLNGAETSMGLSASVERDMDRLWSAQLAFLSGQLSTDINLVNTGSVSRAVRLVAIADDGVEREAYTLQLGAGEQFLADVTAVFKAVFPNGSETAGGAFAGSLRVEADGPGVIGDVVFHDPAGGRSAAALSLQTRAFQSAVFGHFADTAEFFTGVALHNPGAEEAEVTVTVHGQDGAIVGESRFAIAPGARLSRQVTELAASASGRLGGYLRLESTQPLVAQEVFGDRALRSLSAVPPAVSR